MDGPRWLRAGVVARPHGLDGSVHVAQARPRLLEPGGDLRLRAPGEEAVRPVRVVRRAGTPERPIVRLEGVDGRDAAEALRGADLLVPRARAPRLEDDEWWAEDLEGCSVADGAREVGRVRRLLALPSCEVLEVERPGAPDLLVPLVDDAVRSVDVPRRRVDVDLAFLGEDG